MGAFLWAGTNIKQKTRLAKCIDNGPMEGFWGILKRERYYGKRFASREELVQMIENYIAYYNTPPCTAQFGHTYTDGETLQLSNGG